YGDVNLDGNVDIADAVAVASYVGDGAKNTLSDEALKNADVQAVGDGVTANDALAIQQYLANVVKELPV
ncbi:MAG: dockerin type I repeat-containing protein, partial [Ruminococcus sp.]